MSLPLTTKDIHTNVQDPCKLSMMSCAVCIVEDEFHDSFSVVRRCVVGTMRCEYHRMKCANCKDEVQADAQLLCFACGDSSQGSVYHERLTTRPAVQEKCHFDKTTPDSLWGCGCSKCMENTAQFYLARAIEEGYASSLSSPMASPKPDAFGT
jgi:hypothetical protein